MVWTIEECIGTPPSARRAHTATFDEKGRCVYVFGGGDGVKALNDLWVLQLNVETKNSQKKSSVHVWNSVQTYGTAPAPRGYHTANIVDRKLLLFGGSDGHDCFADLHFLDLDTKHWTTVDLSMSPSVYTPKAPSTNSCYPEATFVPNKTHPGGRFTIARLAHSSTVVGHFLFVIGGHNGQKYSGDVLLLNLITLRWELKTVFGSSIPCGRGYHGAFLHDSRVYMLGGYDGKNVLGDLWTLELAGFSYLPRILSFTLGQSANVTQELNRRESSVRFDMERERDTTEEAELVSEKSTAPNTRRNSTSGVQIIGSSTTSLYNIITSRNEPSGNDGTGSPGREERSKPMEPVNVSNASSSNDSVQRPYGGNYVQNPMLDRNTQYMSQYGNPGPEPSSPYNRMQQPYVLPVYQKPMMHSQFSNHMNNYPPQSPRVMNQPEDIHGFNGRAPGPTLPQYPPNMNGYNMQHRRGPSNRPQ
jgi:hypothetical protein